MSDQPTTEETLPDDLPLTGDAFGGDDCEGT